MPYKQIEMPAKRKDSKPRKPETIEASEMQKEKRKSAIRIDE